MGNETVATVLVSEKESAETIYMVMTELENWEKVVALVLVEFGYGWMEEEDTW